jgi:hypothetical protein
MAPSVHDDESSLPIGDHDNCVSFQEFRTLRNMVKGMADDVKLMKDMLMISTPERGSMLDTQRKQDAEIALVRAELAIVKAAQATPLSRRVLEGVILTAASTVTVLTIALLGKGIVVSIMTEALKLYGGAK